MTTGFLPGTLVWALWWAAATGHWWMYNCPSAVASQLLKTGFKAGTAGSPMTEHGARVFATS